MEYYTKEEYMCIDKSCMLWDFGIECDKLSHQRCYYRVYNNQNKQVGYSYEDNGFITRATGRVKLGTYNDLAKATKVIIAHAEIARVEREVTEASTEHLDYNLLNKLINMMRKYGGTIDYYGFGIDTEKVKKEIFNKVERNKEAKELFKTSPTRVFLE